MLVTHLFTDPTAITIANGLIIVVWFSIGGFRDLVRLYRSLASYKVDVADDGTVPAPTENRAP